LARVVRLSGYSATRVEADRRGRTWGRFLQSGGLDGESRSETQRFRRYAHELGLLLWALWDPIDSGVPLDEYEDYVPGIWGLLERHTSAEEIATELRRISTELIETDRGTAEVTATRLVAWWYWRFEHEDETPPSP
jgi:hypothetical protein